MESVFVANGTHWHEFASIVVGVPRSGVTASESTEKQCSGSGDTTSALFLRRLRNSGTSPIVSRFVGAESPRPLVLTGMNSQASSSAIAKAMTRGASGRYG